MKLDKNIAILAGAAIAYIAQNTYDIAEAFDECTVKQLQSIAENCDYALDEYQVSGSDEAYVKAIITAVDFLRIAVEEYEALERED